MIVLGLNGCHKRSHDSTACLVKDGKILAVAEEERFVRQKRAFDKYPINATKFCLDQAGIMLNQIDQIAIGFDENKEQKSVKDEVFLEEIFPKRFFGTKKKIPINYINHHMAHVGSVFFTSDMQESAILVIDGQGEKEATSIFYGKGNDIKLVKSYDYNYSLGYLYSAISIFCGLGGFGAGKLMGLAAYGKPVYLQELREIFSSIKLKEKEEGDSQDEFADFVIDKLIKKGFEKAEKTILLNATRGVIERHPEIKKEHKDLAASTQAFLEEKLIELAREARQLTNSENLCLSGGVAMNCVANSVVENSDIFKKIFIQPACEDSGSAIGAALIVSKSHIDHYLSPYMGPEYSNKLIKTLLEELKLYYEYVENIESRTAELVAEGKIVGWVQGRMEFGPRALGNRSILADPRNKDNHKKVNLAKGRELWRPFAPSLLEEKGSELLEDFVPSPFMLKSFSVKKEWRTRLAAITHTDGTTRPQTVTRDQNERYYKLIREFYRITGVPAILNTSFNYAGEPVVSSPADAVRTFYTSGLDCLVLGNYLVRK